MVAIIIVNVRHMIRSESNTIAGSMFTSRHSDDMFQTGLGSIFSRLFLCLIDNWNNKVEQAFSFGYSDRRYPTRLTYEPFAVIYRSQPLTNSQPSKRNRILLMWNMVKGKRYVEKYFTESCSRQVSRFALKYFSRISLLGELSSKLSENARA